MENQKSISALGIARQKSNGMFLGDQDLVGGCPRSAQGTEGSELKQFATDFLSLYCM